MTNASNLDVLSVVNKKDMPSIEISVTFSNTDNNEKYLLSIKSAY